MKITIELTSLNDRQIEALKMLTEEKPQAKEPQAKEPQAKEPQAKEPQAKEPQAKEPQAKEPQAKEPQAKEPQVESAHNLTDIRTKLGEVIKFGGDTRDKCADKLKEFGAKNVSTLKKEHYDEFMQFLNEFDD